MAWDWQVFCKDTTTATVMAGCFGKGGDITYLQWMFPAWGWTLSVAGCALVVAMVVGVAGRHAPHACPTAPGWCAWPMPGSSCSATSRSWCRSSSGTS